VTSWLLRIGRQRQPMGRRELRGEVREIDPAALEEHADAPAAVLGAEQQVRCALSNRLLNMLLPYCLAVETHVPL
jgi:hypothetical protein